MLTYNLYQRLQVVVDAVLRRVFSSAMWPRTPAALRGRGHRSMAGEGTASYVRACAVFGSRRVVGQRQCKAPGRAPGGWFFWVTFFVHTKKVTCREAVCPQNKHKQTFDEVDFNERSWAYWHYR